MLVITFVAYSLVLLSQTSLGLDWNTPPPWPPGGVIGSAYGQGLPTLRMNCHNFPESCQNICWWKYCRRGVMKFACDPRNQGANRPDSGCQGSPCSGRSIVRHMQPFVANGGLGRNYPPQCSVSRAARLKRISQSSPRIPFLTPYIDANPSCDEFPPNTFLQTCSSAPTICFQRCLQIQKD